MSPIKQNFSTTLAQNPIFSHLTKAELTGLLDSTVQRRFQAGEWIVHHGDTWPYLFYVVSGEVNAIKESLEGRRMLLETLRPGEVFWGLAFFLPEQPMPAALVAAQACELLLWSQESLLPLLHQNGTLAWELSRMVIRRVLRASALVEELAFHPVAGRLANLLLERYPAAQDETLERDLTLDELAARIGSTREMVCRLLYRFAESGAIHINRTEFKIMDPELLESFAQKTKG